MVNSAIVVCLSDKTTYSDLDGCEVKYIAEHDLDEDRDIGQEELSKAHITVSISEMLQFWNDHSELRRHVKTPEVVIRCVRCNHHFCQFSKSAKIDNRIYFTCSECKTVQVHDVAFY